MSGQSTDTPGSSSGETDDAGPKYRILSSKISPLSAIALEREYGELKRCNSHRKRLLSAKLGISEDHVIYWFKKRATYDEELLGSGDYPMRRSSLFSEEVKQMLIDFHDNVNPIPQAEHYPDLCKRTNLKECQIRNWLNQYRRRLAKSLREGRKGRKEKKAKSEAKVYNAADGDSDEEDVRDSDDDEEEIQDSDEDYKPNGGALKKLKPVVEEIEEELPEETEKLLEAQFTLGHYCHGKLVGEIMEKTGLTKPAISKWFRQRRRRNDEDILMDFFATNPHPSRRELVQLMNSTRFDTVNKVEAWFESRRNEKRPVGRPRKNRPDSESRSNVPSHLASASPRPSPVASDVATTSNVIPNHSHSTRRQTLLKARSSVARVDQSDAQQQIEIQEQLRTDETSKVAESTIDIPKPSTHSQIETDTSELGKPAAIKLEMLEEETSEVSIGNPTLMKLETPEKNTTAVQNKAQAKDDNVSESDTSGHTAATSDPCHPKACEQESSAEYSGHFTRSHKKPAESLSEKREFPLTAQVETPKKAVSSCESPKSAGSEVKDSKQMVTRALSGNQLSVSELEPEPVESEHCTPQQTQRTSKRLETRFLSATNKSDAVEEAIEASPAAFYSEEPSEISKKLANEESSTPVLNSEKKKAIEKVTTRSSSARSARQPILQLEEPVGLLNQPVEKPEEGGATPASSSTSPQEQSNSSSNSEEKPTTRTLPSSSEPVATIRFNHETLANECTTYDRSKTPMETRTIIKYPPIEVQKRLEAQRKRNADLKHASLKRTRLEKEQSTAGVGSSADPCPASDEATRKRRLGAPVSEVRSPAKQVKTELVKNEETVQAPSPCDQRTQSPEEQASRTPSEAVELPSMEVTTLSEHSDTTDVSDDRKEPSVPVETDSSTSSSPAPTTLGSSTVPPVTGKEPNVSSSAPASLKKKKKVSVAQTLVKKKKKPAASGTPSQPGPSGSSTQPGSSGSSAQPGPSTSSTSTTPASSSTPQTGRVALIYYKFDGEVFKLDKDKVPPDVDAPLVIYPNPLGRRRH